MQIALQEPELVQLQKRFHEIKVLIASLRLNVFAKEANGGLGTALFDQEPRDAHDGRAPHIADFRRSQCRHHLVELLVPSRLDLVDDEVIEDTKHSLERPLLLIQRFSRRFSVFLKLSERLAAARIILFFRSFLTKRKAMTASKAADSKTERINAMRRDDIGANSQRALARRSSTRTERRD